MKWLALRLYIMSDFKNYVVKIMPKSLSRYLVRFQEKLKTN